MGFALNGRCRPKMDLNKASYDLVKFIQIELLWAVESKVGIFINLKTFKEIQDNWYYEDVSHGSKRVSNIPTLDTWLKTFANDQRIKLIWLDVKVKYFYGF